MDEFVINDETSFNESDNESDNDHIDINQILGGGSIFDAILDNIKRGGCYDLYDRESIDKDSVSDGFFESDDASDNELLVDEMPFHESDQVGGKRHKKDQPALQSESEDNDLLVDEVSHSESDGDNDLLVDDVLPSEPDNNKSNDESNDESEDNDLLVDEATPSESDNNNESDGDNPFLIDEVSPSKLENNNKSDRDNEYVTPHIDRVKLLKKSKLGGVAHIISEFVSKI